eukprot:TRINITY_DN80376_c0_g1_i1.p1 TRINITY_DN80376_c0_g1~~TRINITY_DN80376_c0_g1_i1.p1  ORF type:complete len:250 (+),score=42.62 TRINITY_DN80376_c0_g1_i1:105-854(+)
MAHSTFFGYLLFLSILGGCCEKVLIVGDSMAEFAKSTLATHCGGVTVVNKGSGGSTAAQWAQNTDCCNTAEAVTAVGTTPKIAWLSVGGNDFMNGGCSTAQPLQSNIEKAIANLQAKAAGVKVILTGYAGITADLEISGCSVTKIPDLNNVIKAAAAAKGATYVDVLTVAGGTASTYANKGYFTDKIHLNSKGYCKLWTLPTLQLAFGCKNSPAANCGNVTSTGGSVSNAKRYTVSASLSLLLLASFIR